MYNELKPIETCLGNFIEVMGKIEMVTGIIKVSDDNWQIGHTGWNAGDGVLPTDVLHHTYPIPLTEQWKICFGIEKYNLPEWIKYVHEAQNYFMWALQINLQEIMDWDLLPEDTEIA